nr:integrase [Alloyangia pacifica]
MLRSAVLDHTTMERIVRHLGVRLGDALAIAEALER